MESAAASSTPYGTTAQFEEWQGAASVGVPCCGLGCSVASVARQHFCVVCKQNCCAICQWKTADGGDNELAKWIVCIRHRGEGGGSNSSGQGGDILSAGAASQGSAAPIVNDVVRTVTPPPEEAEVVDAAINAILPTITAEQRQRAVSLIAGKGNIYNTNMNFLCRKVDFSRKKGMVIGSALKPNNVSASVATPNHWLCVTNNSLEEAVIHVCVFNRLLTKEQQKAEKTLYTNMPAGIKKKLAKRKDRLNNQKRPAPLPSANDVGGNDGAAASAPRRSIRNLNQTSIATSQDPRRQQIARERAGPILNRGSGDIVSNAGSHGHLQNFLEDSEHIDLLYNFLRNHPDKMEKKDLDEENTLLYLQKMFREMKGKTDPKKNKYKNVDESTTVARAIIPTPLVNRSEERYTTDNASVQESKRITPLRGRLEGVAAKLPGSYETWLQGTKLVMNFKNEDRIMRSLLPFCQMNQTYSYQKCQDLPDKPEEVLWKNQEYSSSHLLQCRSMKSSRLGSVIYVDTHNVLGLGREFAFFLVQDYMSRERLERTKHLSRETSMHCLPIFITLLCNLDHDHTILLEEEKAESAKKSQETYLSQLDICKEEIIPVAEKFVFDLMLIFLKHYDFKTIKMSALERIPWILWNRVLPKRYWDCVSEEQLLEVKLCYKKIRERVQKDNPEATTVELQKLYSEAIHTATVFHYAIIMGISQQSVDETTRCAYERVMYNVYDPQSFLENIAKVESFGMFYEGVVELLRCDSLQVSKTITILQTAVKFCVDGMLRGTTLRSIHQIGHKKQRIVDNCLLDYSKSLSDWAGLGLDSHVKRALGLIVQQVCGTEDLNETMQYVGILGEVFHPKVGVFTNEILGTFGQFIDRAKKDSQTRILMQTVFGELRDMCKDYRKVLTRWELKDLKV